MDETERKSMSAEEFKSLASDVLPKLAELREVIKKHVSGEKGLFSIVVDIDGYISVMECCTDKKWDAWAYSDGTRAWIHGIGEADTITLEVSAG